jgi:hypothetical protein
MVATSDLIAGYAYRFWIRRGMTEWPTVRHAARSLGITQGDIAECESGEYYLCGYRDDEPLGDLTVEAATDAVEVAWCKYWLPYSRSCCCGRHLQVIALP